MSEQQPEDGVTSQLPSEFQQPADDALAFPDLKRGDAWGDSITKRRTDELEARLQAWEQEKEHGERKGPFDGGPDNPRAQMTGADVFWLAARTLADTGKAHVVTAQMGWLRRAREYFRLRDGLELSALYGSGDDLRNANLDRTTLRRADLVRVGLSKVNLSGARLFSANLSGAFLPWVNLSGAILHNANLSGAELFSANLSGAFLHRAHLSGAKLLQANLSGANLSRVTFDTTTDLSKVRVTDTPGRFTALFRRLRHQPTVGPVRLADLHWNDVDLTVVDWSGLRRLGDERGNSRWWRTREESEQAARANTQLTQRLRDAGLNDDADRFAYRAQVCQRSVHLRRFRLGRWLFSWLLFIIAGYGYRPLRTLFWYLAVIGAFAFAYFQATHGVLTFGLPPSQIQPLPWYEALVLSVSSFHGRGFFQPVQSLGDPVAILAAAEAVFGLFIEVSFIATFTQRYFGK